jgi:hypothetical protein
MAGTEAGDCHLGRSLLRHALMFDKLVVDYLDPEPVERQGQGFSPWQPAAEQRGGRSLPL